MSITEGTRRLGWGLFRSAEEAVIAAQLQRERVVLDLGGGAVLDPATRERLRRGARVVFLDCPAHVLLARSQRSYPRPALTALPPAEELLLKLAERRPLYLSCADLVIDGSLSPSECAAAILENLRDCGGGRGVRALQLSKEAC
jgi:shikimate kinase